MLGLSTFAGCNLEAECPQILVITSRTANNEDRELKEERPGPPLSIFNSRRSLAFLEVYIVVWDWWNRHNRSYCSILIILPGMMAVWDCTERSWASRVAAFSRMLFRNRLEGRPFLFGLRPQDLISCPIYAWVQRAKTEATYTSLKSNSTIKNETRKKTGLNRLQKLILEQTAPLSLTTAKTHVSGIGYCSKMRLLFQINQQSTV